jgi:hypothetical protein
MANKIEIVSVIEIINGIVSPPKSFVIPNGNSDVNRTEIADMAEKLFVDCAKENGMEDDLIEESIDSGSYDNRGGYEVLLVWSEVMN